MKKVLFLAFFFSLSMAKAQRIDLENINSVLDTWHKSAAEANFKDYFNAMTDDAIFIGTDATENWDKKAFQAFAKPYFDRGKAWNFTALERHIYFSKDGKTAWFDELLNTQMKICRGSGVMALVDGQWKIKHYVLSMTVPNDNTDEVVKIKTPIEDKFISELKAKKK
ncbi:nuclear transport factor 2 family protein [Flavobacterium terrisoli]|uniref:nuclear transport factor 2 family protein n=1 Tax=Flavobacterium terrisoli TaxID=3242195 RepID=UPI002543BA9C|nr:nuclear transport factor 2 family protein [Flavobacterium buctense]